MDSTLKEKDSVETTSTMGNETLPPITGEKTSSQLRDELLSQQPPEQVDDKKDDDVTEIPLEEPTEDKKEDEETKDDTAKEDDAKEEDSEEYDLFEKEDEFTETKDTNTTEEEIDEETLAMNKIIDERVKEATKTEREKVNQMVKESAFNEFINSKEGKKFEPFKDEIKRYIHDEKLKGFKFAAIGYMVAGPKLIKMGAERYKVALEKSQKSRLGGNAPRKGEPSETTSLDKFVNNADSKSFLNFTEQVKAGKIKVV